VNGLVSLMDVGALQGGLLCLVLSNIYLSCFGRGLEGCGCVFVRCADGCNIFVKSVCAGWRVVSLCSVFFEWKLWLRVGVGMCGVGFFWGLSFWGFFFFVRLVVWLGLFSCVVGVEV
jgi:RNA-directed DNA polymerase